jgi:diguanylate cyclase (GGDEF)-like protein
MLILLCNACQEILRKTELFARISGEEFALLMPDTNLKGALHLAERIRMVVDENRLLYNVSV